MNLGKKFTCFKCKTKFYDLGKSEPLCPKCHTDQRLDPNPSGSDLPTTKSKGSSAAAAAKRARPIGEEGEEEEFEEEFIDEGEGSFDDEEDDFSRDYDGDHEEREEEHDDDYE